MATATAAACETMTAQTATLDQLCLLAHSEAWCAVGRDVVDGTLPDAPLDETATGLAELFLEETRSRCGWLSAREGWRLFQAYVAGFLDAVETFQAA